MIRWTSLVFLTACFGDPTTSGTSPEARATGFWSLTIRATATELDQRIDLRGEVRVIGPCEDAPGPVGDTPLCTGDMRAWYRLVRPRPTSLPPCDEAEVRLPDNSDSVIVILSPHSDFLRRELRGVLQGNRIVGQWAGPTNAGWGWLQSTFRLHRVERSSGLTELCDR